MAQIDGQVNLKVPQPGGPYELKCGSAAQSLSKQALKMEF